LPTRQRRRRLEALRVLKRRLSDVVYRAVKADATIEQRLAA